MEHPNYDIWLLECKNDPNLPKIELSEPEPVDNDLEKKEENAL